MTVQIEEATRKQVAEFLPKAIRRAFDSYYEYAGSDWRYQEDPADKKEKKTVSKLFAEHHAACKTALSHIELLLKLGKLTGLETRADYTHLAMIRQGARDEVDAYRKETEAEDDDGHSDW